MEECRVDVAVDLWKNEIRLAFKRKKAKWKKLKRKKVTKNLLVKWRSLKIEVDESDASVDKFVLGCEVASDKIVPRDF